MAVKSSSLLFRILVLLVVLFVVVSIADAARGGGRGGGRSTSRTTSKSKSRSKSRSSGSSRSKRKGFLGSNTATKAAIAAGVIYGASSWRRRRLYYSNPDRVPTACYNDRYQTNEYGNVSYLGRVICPGDGDEDDAEYCCGDEGQQTCCSYFDDAGRTAGVVIGIIVAFVVVGVCIFCCCKRKVKGGKTPAQSFRSRFSKPSAGPSHEMAAVPLNPPQVSPNKGPTYYPPATTYQPYAQPMGVAQPPVMPPSYDSATGPAPYDVNNQGAPPVGFVPPAAGFQPPPTGDAPPPTGDAPPPTGYQPQGVYPAYDQQGSNQGQGSDMSKPPLPPGDMSGAAYPPGDAYGVQPDAPPYAEAYPTGHYTAPPYGVQPYPGASPSPQPYPAPQMGFDSQGAVPYPAQPPPQ